MSLWWCEGAWLGGDQVTPEVLLEVSDGRLVGCTPGAEIPTEATVLNGLTLPGLANAHSHAFHRALRSRT
ncbi:MAG: formimidoylglutamate deiminase, partial [Actinobacteria bacterium]|nr:formimidoylglutamate deiminase [Actinomycetota bacterium]